MTRLRFSLSSPHCYVSNILFLRNLTQEHIGENREQLVYHIIFVWAIRPLLDELLCGISCAWCHLPLYLYTDTGSACPSFKSTPLRLHVDVPIGRKRSAKTCREYFQMKLILHVCTHIDVFGVCDGSMPMRFTCDSFWGLMYFCWTRIKASLEILE